MSCYSLYLTNFNLYIKWNQNSLVHISVDSQKRKKQVLFKISRSYKYLKRFKFSKNVADFFGAFGCCYLSSERVHCRMLLRKRRLCYGLGKPIFLSYSSSS